MVVTLNTPKEMTRNNSEGLSVWLYRIIRDEDRLNAPPEWIGPNGVRRPPLPLRLHYLITPITRVQSQTGPETEQVILGKILQTFYDHPTLRGTDLQGDFSGTERVASDALVGVLGIPHHVFPALALRDYCVQLTVQANGYVSRRPAVVISIDQRAIADPPPAMHATVITLIDAARLLTFANVKVHW